MSARFELPSDLNIYTAAATREQLLAWATAQRGQGERLELDAKAVEEVDSAGLQLVAALANLGSPWGIVDPSPAFVDACRAMNLQDWIG